MNSPHYLLRSAICQMSSGKCPTQFLSSLNFTSDTRSSSRHSSFYSCVMNCWTCARIAQRENSPRFFPPQDSGCLLVTLFSSWRVWNGDRYSHITRDRWIICKEWFYKWVTASIFSGSLVTTAWRVLRLQMEKKAFRHRGELRLYWISSFGHPTMGDPPEWGNYQAL
jgi:hypothetical protein